jgi:cytolysin-activating lysine-acyltransferase
VRGRDAAVCRTAARARPVPRLPDTGRPAGFPDLGTVLPAAERKLITGEPLNPEDWNSGDRLWIVDMVAPYRGLASGIVRWIMQPGNVAEREFLFRRVSDDNRTRRILSIDFDRPGLKRLYSEEEFLAGL